MKKEFFLSSFFILIWFFLIFSQPVKGGHGCNEKCKSNPDSCNSPNICIIIPSTSIKKCRNPDCPNETNCVCPTPTLAPPGTLTVSCNSPSGPMNLSWGASSNANGYYVSKGNLPCSTSADWNYNYAWISAPTTSYSDSSGITPGITYCYNVKSCRPGQTCSDFKYTNQVNIACPTPTNTPTPTPTLYPTAVISGALKERLDSNCPSDISSGSISIGVTPANPTGITSNCGVTPPAPGTLSSYRCTINFNNQTAQPTPAQDFTLSANAAGYPPGYWTQNNACLGSQTTTLSINVASGNPNDYLKNKDIFFRANQPWIKLKNSAFSSNNNLANFIPLNITAYDSDDSGLRYFIIGEASVVTAPLIDLGTVPVSSKRWKIDGYTATHQFNPFFSVFLDYVKSRKEYQIITNLNSLSENKINLWQGDLTIINQIHFNNKKVVLLVEGTLNLNIKMPNFKPANSSVAIISQTINFNQSVRYAEGVFIAQTITTGETDNQGLKIKGNLITQSLNNQRKWEDNSKPSVFIVFDPKPYLDLLPYLSVSAYEWTEL